MFKRLSDFYQSETWRSFRKALIEERTSSDGVLRSEKSGAPLMHDYEAVLHHMKPLTLANVNDAEISLNPKNIMIVSQREHNEIHKRFGYCAERKIYLVCGAPCSGKTSFVKKSKGNSDIVADIDSVWEALSGSRYDKPSALKTIVFESYNGLIDMIKKRAGKWERAWVISGEGYPSARERLRDSLGAELIMIDTSKAECLRRLHDDPNGRDLEAWTKYINDWFERNDPPVRG